MCSGAAGAVRSLQVMDTDLEASSFNVPVMRRVSEHPVPYIILLFQRIAWHHTASSS